WKASHRARPDARRRSNLACRQDLAISLAVAPLQLGQLALRLGEAQVARADPGIQVVLDPVDAVGLRLPLRPEVLRVVRGAAELERDEVVFFVVGGGAGEAV